MTGGREQDVLEGQSLAKDDIAHFAYQDCAWGMVQRDANSHANELFRHLCSALRCAATTAPHALDFYVPVDSFTIQIAILTAGLYH